jgi:hypothetical protein
MRVPGVGDDAADGAQRQTGDPERRDGDRAQLTL